MLTNLASSALRSASGRPMVLGQKIGGGGEGTVYAIEGDPSIAAKIYNSALSKDRANKLEVMLSVGHSDLFAVTAWPSDLLLRNGHIVGFVMPKAVDAHEVHVLYGPKSRKQTFPNAGYRFLVHVAMNIARGFAVVHKHGLVVGDINERIALVGREGTVCLIDCDSFQLTSAGQTFLCEVGVPTFTPPELQNVLSFRGVPRTEQHDLFGVAVLLFHMLFFGRHPFSGRHQTNPEMPLETVIRECRFAYAPDRERTLIVAPPNAPTLATAGGPIALLFERAFSPAAARGAIARPSASQWADALHQLLGQLTSCSHNAAHAYVGSLSACPWCAMEMTSRVELFNYSAPAGQSVAKLDVDAIWQAIDAIPTIALKPAAAIHTASTQYLQLSAEGAILVRARAAMDKLQRATSVRLADQRKLAATEQRLAAAAVALADAAASVDRYPEDVSRLGALETQLGRKQRALGRAARLTRGLVWCVGPVLLGIAAAMQASPTVLPALAAPLMIVLASYYTYMRLDVRVALLKRDAEALQKTIKRGLPHRQKEVSLRTSQLRAAKDEVLQCQGLVYECDPLPNAPSPEIRFSGLIDPLPNAPSPEIRFSGLM